MSRKNEEARMILPKGMNYITVLDFEVGKVFQYKLPKRRPFEDIGYENYITNKQKRGVRREVDLELGVKSPRNIIFKSKKIYTRKSKHKNNTN